MSSRRAPTSHPLRRHRDSEKCFICLHKVPFIPPPPPFLSCDWWETKLQRSEETLTATSPPPSMKRGSGRSVNMIKKTGNLLAMKEHCAAFHTSFNVPCVVPLESEAPVCICTFDGLTPACLVSVCLSKKLYIFNWLSVLWQRGVFLCVCVSFIFSQQVFSIGWAVQFQYSPTVKNHQSEP